MRAGDCVVIPPHVPHGDGAGPEGCTVLDVFSPPRAAILGLMADLSFSTALPRAARKPPGGDAAATSPLASGCHGAVYAHVASTNVSPVCEASHFSLKP
jgi:hypothetical protein